MSKIAALQLRKQLEHQKCVKILEDHHAKYTSYTSQFVYNHPSVNVVHDPKKGRCLRTVKSIPAGSVILAAPSISHKDFNDNQGHGQLNLELGTDLFNIITSYGTTLDKGKVLTDTLHDASTSPHSSPSSKQQHQTEYPLSEVNPVAPQYLFPSFAQSEHLPNPLVSTMPDGTSQHASISVPTHLPQPVVESFLAGLKNPVGYAVFRRCCGISIHNSIMYPGDAPFIIPPAVLIQKPNQQQQQQQQQQRSKSSAGKKKHGAKQQQRKAPHHQGNKGNPSSTPSSSSSSMTIHGSDQPMFNTLNMFSLLSHEYKLGDDVSATYLRAAPTPEPGPNGLAVFPTFSLLNHSCTPNVTPLFFNIPSPDVIQNVHEYARQCIKEAIESGDNDHDDAEEEGEDEGQGLVIEEIGEGSNPSPKQDVLSEKIALMNFDPTAPEELGASGDENDAGDDDLPAVIMKEGSVPINIPREESIGLLAVCVAITDIPAGTELCINYTPLVQPEVLTLPSGDPVLRYVPWLHQFRQKELERLHYTPCDCLRCELCRSMAEACAGPTSPEATTTSTTTSSSTSAGIDFNTVLDKYPVDIVSKELLLNSVVHSPQQSRLDTTLLPSFITCDRQTGLVKDGGLPSHPKDYVPLLKQAYEHPLWQSFFRLRSGQLDSDTSPFALNELFHLPTALYTAISSILTSSAPDAPTTSKTDTASLPPFPLVIPHIGKDHSNSHTHHIHPSSSPLPVAVTSPSTVEYAPTIEALRKYDVIQQGMVAYARSVSRMAAIEEEEEHEGDVAIINMSEKSTTETSPHVKKLLRAMTEYKALITLIETILVDLLGIVDPREAEQHRIEDTKRHIAQNREKYRRRLEIDYFQRLQALRNELNDQTAQLAEPDYEEELRLFDQQHADYQHTDVTAAPRTCYVPLTHWLTGALLSQLGVLYDKVGAYSQSLVCSLYALMLAGLSIPLTDHDYIYTEMNKHQEYSTPQLDWGYSIENFTKADPSQFTLSQCSKPSVGAVVKPIHSSLVTALSDLIQPLNMTASQVSTAIHWATEESGDDIEWLVKFQAQILFFGESIEKLTF